MTSDFLRQQVERLLGQAAAALDRLDWQEVRARAQAVLALDPDNADAKGLVSAANRALDTLAEASREPDPVPSTLAALESQPAVPATFASRRYTVKRFLGEGGKKRVYLAHDTLLDRDVAFALIKTEGLDDTGRDRIRREAQAMGRLGAHPHIVSVFDLGEEADGQPYIVTELMGGGDVEGLIDGAPEHRLELGRSLEIGIQVCRGLEFAHSHGIVHRDLKPGNVWLTTDGTAKLGDFGLAVALDRSRLTQAGMMVGTVSYMPPEQAMGGEVTPCSDLYSLGAMLYEMVTGRPPFVGDESVAIITQHLNTSPVSPSWHNPSIPPALEALILRLLEKDTAKRPASAQEVQAALGQLATLATPSPKTAGQSIEAVAIPEDQNPMYRRTFVGREAELRQLQTAFDAALSGHGSLVMVGGEPGIGKTSLTEQLATYAVIRGGKALVGHCYEEGSLSLPYLPFVEVMRSYVLEREPDGLRKDLGSGAGDVARIVSEVRDRVQVELRPAGDPEEERWRLLQAVSGFLRNASTVHPLLLILEDLHDADRGTLDLLVHLAHNLIGVRLLIAGTYRDVEVDRSHPLSGAMAELRRGAEFGRVLLRGLGTPEVQRMLVAITGSGVPGSLAESIHRQTEGNPLFVQEVVRYLVEEGHLGRGGLASSTAAGISIPEGLRDVIGRRLARLSSDCNRLLAISAVIGRDFTLTTLQSISGRSPEELVDTLDEAVHTAVLTEQERVGEVQYHFAHAFFRQTLYEELGAARRIQFHQQVARALESQYVGRLSEHAAELAEHFAHSSDRADLAKAVEFAEVAAERAVSVYAHGEAVRHLEQALDVQEVLDPDDKAKRCDLLLMLGDALVSLGQTTRAIEEVAPEVLKLAEALGDRRRASQACRIVQRGTGQDAVFYASTEGQSWAELADRYADDETVERVYADVFLGLALSTTTGGDARSLGLWRHATQLARRLDNQLALVASTQFLLLGNSTPPQVHDERIEVAEEVASRSLEVIGGAMVANTLLSVGQAFLTWGRRSEAERQWQRAKEAAARSHDAEAAFVPFQIDALVATVDGQLDRSIAVGAEIRSLGVEVDRQQGARQLSARAERRALIYLGRADEALAGILDTPDPFATHGVFSSQRALCLAHLGRATEAREILDRMLAIRNLGSNEDLTPVSPLKYLLEAAILLRDVESARLLAGRLVPLAGLLHTEADMCYNIGRLCGGASALCGETEKARGYYQQAIEICEKVRFRPELALTRLELAELLLAQYPDERPAAIEHLDFAISEFREMKMQPSLERALRHKEVLKA